MVETVPALAFRTLPIAFQVRHAVVGSNVVLTRHVENAVGPHSLEHFVGRIELVSLRELGNVAGVEHERRCLR